MFLAERVGEEWGVTEQRGEPPATSRKIYVKAFHSMVHDTIVKGQFDSSSCF